MTHIIYGLYDPTEEDLTIRYVGYTSKSMERRLTEHISEAKAKATSHRHKWIRSLLQKGIKPEIILIELVNANSWQEREAFWIKAFSQYRLVNATAGGEGLIAPSQDVRERISASVSEILKGNTRRKGKAHDEQSKAAISSGLRASEKKRIADAARRSKPGHKLSDEAKRKIGEANKDRKHPPRSDEWRQKQRESHLGKTQSPDTIARRAATLIGNQRGLGHQHSDTAKQAISVARSGGKWSTNGKGSKYLKAGELLPEGWHYGRVKKDKT